MLAMAQRNRNFIDFDCDPDHRLDTGILKRIFLALVSNIGAVGDWRRSALSEVLLIIYKYKYVYFSHVVDFMLCEIQFCRAKCQQKNIFMDLTTSFIVCMIKLQDLKIFVSYNHKI